MLKDVKPRTPETEIRPGHLDYGGRIRLGSPKPERGPGKNLPYFRLTDAPAVARAYGDQPDEIRIMFLMTTVEENLRAWYSRYGGGGVTSCRGDGEHIVRLVDPNGVERVIRDFEVIEPYTEQDGRQYAPGDRVRCPGLDEASYYPRCHECRPEVRLFFGVRDPLEPRRLIENALVYYDLVTPSVAFNYQTLLSRLSEVYKVAGSLRFAPFILRRVSAKTQYIYEKDGQQKRGTRDTYVLDLHLDHEIVGEAYMQMMVAASPMADAPVLSSGSAARAALPQGDDQVIDGHADVVIDEPENAPVARSAWNFTEFWGYVRQTLGIENGLLYEILGVADADEMQRHYDQDQAQAICRLYHAVHEVTGATLNDMLAFAGIATLGQWQGTDSELVDLIESGAAG